MVSSNPDEELKQLQRCMSDMISVLALPAVWSGQEPRQIVTTSHDALMAMLDLDFLYTWARIEADGAPIEELRTSSRYATANHVDDLQRDIHERFGDDPSKWPAEMRGDLGGHVLSLICMRLGIEAEVGAFLVGSERADFPTEPEQLLLRMAANQAAVGLQQARLLREQKRVADELDRRVAERTKELAGTTEELQIQVELLQRLPVVAWTLKPDGKPDFVNQVWHEYTGQTPAFVRSHPEAWLQAVHPDDREEASRRFWEGVSSGQAFSMETRILRARDGSYRWHLHRAVALRDAGGKVLKFAGTSIDIDDRRRAEDELRASEGKLLRVIDTIPTLSWCNLADGPNEFLSKSWHEYTGLSPEESHGWGWSKAFHSDDLPSLLKRWQEVLVSGEGGEIEARLRRYDGVYRWFLIRVAPYRDETGRIVRWYGTSTDIEDRKRVEDELRRSEAGYRVVVETASDAVISMDDSGTIILANPATKRVFGHNPDNLIGKPLTVLMPQGMRELHESGYKRYLKTGVPHLNWQGTEVTALRANGEEFPVEVSFGETVADGHRTFTGFIRDISEKKRSEEAILANQRNLRLIIDTMPVLAWSAEPDGVVDFFNQRWLDYTGLSVGETLGWDWSKALHPDDFDRITGYWRSLIRAGEPGEIEGRLRKFDGSYRWFLFRGNPLRDELGAIVKWYGTNTEIHDRKLAEERVLRSEAFLAEAQRLTRVGSLSWRVAEGEIKFSEQLYRIFEFDPRTAITLDLMESRVHPEDIPLFEDMIESARCGSADVGCDYRLLIPGGAIKYLRLVAHADLDHEGRLEYIGAIQDVTQRQLAEADLAKMRAELAEITRITTLGTLTASIAHEVNQPLSGIITNASTCLRMLDSAPPNIDGARETVRRTIRDGSRATEIVMRLRELFGRKEVCAEILDLNEATREVITLLRNDLQSQRVVLELDLAHALPPLNGDRIQLQQVVLNLVRNAAEAMRSIEDRPRRLIIRTEHDAGNVSLMVQDSGVGLSRGDENRVFESFYTTKPDGMGIGLSISRSIIEAHHGQLWTRTHEGPGCTFGFSIPCEDNSQPSAE